MVFAALIPRLVKLGVLRRIGPLRAPTLVVAIGAASAGAVQGIRYGLGLDAVAVASRELVMLPVLGFAVAATVLAVIAARMLGSRSRWSYVPATVYLVAGPIAAIREGWFQILTVLALALLLLPVTADAEQIGRWFSPRGGATAAIVHEFDAAKDSIWVLAYTCTSRPIADALIRAKNRGVEIVVILDSDSVNGRGAQATRLIDTGCLVLSDAAHPIAHNKVSIIAISALSAARSGEPGA